MRGGAAPFPGAALRARSDEIVLRDPAHRAAL